MKEEIIKVNEVDIICPLEKDEHFVAIRTICQALGIDHQKQFERIKNDGILKEVYTDTVYTLDKKGVKQPMFCLPLKYVFGWIFSIDETKVNDVAKPAFIKYKRLCYDALYEKFVQPVSDRNEVLLKKAQLKSEYMALEKKLIDDNEDYQRLMELQGEIMRTGKSIKEIDGKYVSEQLSLFDFK